MRVRVQGTGRRGQCGAPLIVTGCVGDPLSLRRKRIFLILQP
jgi:hypothetical protein